MKLQLKDLIYSRAITLYEASLLSTKKQQDVRDFVQHYSQLLNAAQVFLFEPNFLDEGETKFADVDFDRLYYTLPFKTCYFEVNSKDLSLKSVGTSTERIKEHELHAILVTEEEPGIYSGLLYIVNERKLDVASFRTDQTDNDAVVLSANLLLDEICRYIHSCNMGTEPIFRTVTQKTITMGKNIHKVENIIRLSPKVAKNYPEPAFSREIDWNMQWWVRGHWRKLPAPEILGKDRTGEYCTKGFTWVTEHLRGPEGKPIRNTIYTTGELCQR